MNTIDDTPYARMGGEPAVRRLVERFYQLMDTLPEAAAIRALHSEDLAEARDKLFMFLSGWLGGPPLYSERHGHPRLRARHLRFPIDAAASAAWMLCMEQALAETDIDPGLRARLVAALHQTAQHMRNVP